jgi:hypothetical protein
MKSQSFARELEPNRNLFPDHISSILDGVHWWVLVQFGPLPLVPIRSIGIRKLMRVRSTTIGQIGKCTFVVHNPYPKNLDLM